MRRDYIGDSIDLTKSQRTSFFGSLWDLLNLQYNPNCLKNLIQIAIPTKLSFFIVDQAYLLNLEVR
jgi:hypothetical protein